MTELEGAVVAVTGGARGIGLATAQALEQRGARVHIGDLDRDARTRARRSASASRRVTRVDVTDRASFAAFLDAVQAADGPLDALVNNAGVMPFARFLDEDDAVSAQTIDVNLIGVVNGMRLTLPGMVERRRGHVVNVASLAARVPVPGSAVYSATKAAVVALTDAVRRELRGTGVHLTTILPTAVATELTSGVPLGARPACDPARRRRRDDRARARAVRGHGGRRTSRARSALAPHAGRPEAGARPRSSAAPGRSPARGLRRGRASGLRRPTRCWTPQYRRDRPHGGALAVTRRAAVLSPDSCDAGAPASCVIIGPTATLSEIRSEYEWACPRRLPGRSASSPAHPPAWESRSPRSWPSAVIRLRWWRDARNASTRSPRTCATPTASVSSRSAATCPTRSSRDAMLARLAELDLVVDVLVNNAGYGTSGLFQDLPAADETEMVGVNVEAVVALCAATVPAMAERKRGAVLNVASLIAFQPVAGLGDLLGHEGVRARLQRGAPRRALARRRDRHGPVPRRHANRVPGATRRRARSLATAEGAMGRSAGGRQGRRAGARARRPRVRPRTRQPGRSADRAPHAALADAAGPRPDREQQRTLKSVAGALGGTVSTHDGSASAGGQARREPLVVLDGHGQLGVLDQPKRVEPGHRRAEVDTHAAMPVRGERQPAIRDRQGAGPRS